MAVPTITSITPATGPSIGGTLVTIVGTGFPTPVMTPSSPVTIPTPDYYPSVAITFGGVAAEEIYVQSSTTVVCRTPDYEGAVRASGTGPVPYDQFPAINVVLQNLGTNGVAVPGEIVTRVGGYQFLRRDLGPPKTRGTYKRIQDAFMEWLRRNVCKTVSLGRHSEYADGTSDQVRLATLPAIGLVTVLEKDDGWAQFTAGYEEVTDPADSSRILVYDGIRARQMRCTLLLGGYGTDQVLELCELLEDAVDRQTFLVTAADPVLYPGGSARYEMQWVEVPHLAARGADLDVAAGRAVLLVRGILTMSDQPRERDWKMDTIEVTESDMDGNPGLTTEIT